MRNLFSRNGLPSLRAFCAAPGGVVCAFDFDGTLAPIVERPGDARMSATALERLAALAKLCDVVVISGRSIADLRTRIPVPGVLLAGNHGLESPFVSEDELALSRAASDAWKIRLESAGVGSIPGVELEHKIFSLALHYRRAPGRAAARGRLVALAQALVPAPRLVGGKEVLNLVLPSLPHKGTALAAFQSSLGKERSLFVGDDVTDEDVFALHSPRLFGIRVGRGQNTHARYFVPRQRDVARLLDFLIDALTPAALPPPGSARMA